jgi:hypothetical protein
MGPGRRIAAVVLVGLGCIVRAGAQTSPPTTIIESEGQASVDVAAEEVRFEFTKTFDGPTLIDAAAQALVFEKAVTQALHDLELQPLRQDPVRLLVAGLGQPRTTARVSVTFPMPGEGRVAAAAPSAPPLADLAERLRKAGVSLLAEAMFSGFGVKDHAAPEQEAISRASENALYHADAVGALLEGRVIGVERIVIVETGWDGLDAINGALPIPPAVQCHARVRISYQYSSASL